MRRSRNSRMLGQIRVRSFGTGRDVETRTAATSPFPEEVGGRHANRWIDVGGRLIHVGTRARTVAPVEVP